MKLSHCKINIEMTEASNHDLEQPLVLKEILKQIKTFGLLPARTP